MKDISPQRSCQHDIYLWLNISLLTLLFLFPFRLMYGRSVPAFGVHIESQWVLIASIFLVIVVAVDSVLSLSDWHDHKDGLSVWLVSVLGLFWIFIICITVPYLIEYPSKVAYLAALFLLHACMTGFSLWREHDGWWLWFAWWRDIACALALLIWPAYWP